MCKGSSTTSQSSSVAPNPAVASADLSLIGQAQNTAATPFNGQQLQIAPLSANQNQGIAGIAGANGIQDPYLAAAQGYAQTGAGPISSSSIQNYLNPYTQDVTNATLAQINQQNQIQQNQLQGNTVAQGGLGNNRLGVMQAGLAGQQAQATNSTLANLNSQNYIQALQAAQQDAQRAGYGAFTEGNLGMEAQQGALTGNQAQINAGGLQQQEQQAQNQSAYNFSNQQNAYPFQTQSWLSGILGGLGPQLGSTSSSSTTPPSPNSLNSILGAATAVLPFLLARGGRVPGYAGGGGVVPYGDAASYVPAPNTMFGQLPVASAPSNGSPSGQGSSTDYSQLGKSLGSLGSSIGSLFGGTAAAGTLGTAAGLSGDAASWLPIVTMALNRGGRVAPKTPPDADFARLANNLHHGIHGFRKGGGVVGMTVGSSPALSMPGYADGGGILPDSTYFPSPVAPPSPPFQSMPYALSSDGTDTGMGIPQGVIPRGALPMPPPAPQATMSGWSPDVTSDQPDSSNGVVAAGPSGSDAPTGDWRNAMRTAGFAMMASPSPFVGEAIGQGGLQGMNAYEKSLQQGRTNKMEQSKIDLEAQRLDQAASEAQGRLAEEGKHNRATEAGEVVRNSIMAQPRFTYQPGVDASGNPTIIAGQTRGAAPSVTDISGQGQMVGKSLAHTDMSPTEINANATKSQRAAENAQLAIEKYNATLTGKPIDADAQERIRQSGLKAFMDTKLGHPGVAPVVANGQVQAPAAALKPMPPDVLSQAQAKIVSSGNRNAVLDALKANGFDPAGL